MLKVVKNKDFKKNPKLQAMKTLIIFKTKTSPHKKRKRKEKKRTNIESFTLNVQFSHLWFTKILMRKLSVKILLIKKYFKIMLCLFLFSMTFHK